MKQVLVICLGVMVCWSAAFGAGAAAESFATAERVGEPNERTFFVFSTSAGNYIVRHDGMGEFTSPAGLRRVFNLRLGGKGRIEQVYFLEHQGDVFVFYEVHGGPSGRAFLIRMEQKQRKQRWIIQVDGAESVAPVMRGDYVVIADVEILKANGQLRQDLQD